MYSTLKRNINTVNINYCLELRIVFSCEATLDTAKVHPYVCLSVRPFVCPSPYRNSADIFISFALQDI